MGLNMPARCVVFTAMRKWDGAESRWISSGEYIQVGGGPHLGAGRGGGDGRRLRAAGGGTGAVEAAAWRRTLPAEALPPSPGAQSLSGAGPLLAHASLKPLPLSTAKKTRMLPYGTWSFPTAPSPRTRLRPPSHPHPPPPAVPRPPDERACWSSRHGRPRHRHHDAGGAGQHGGGGGGHRAGHHTGGGRGERTLAQAAGVGGGLGGAAGHSGGSWPAGLAVHLDVRARTQPPTHVSTNAPTTRALLPNLTTCHVMSCLLS